MPRFRLALFVCLSTLAAATSAAEPTLVIRGDHASARAFGADAARLFELKRGQPARVEAYNTVSALEAVARGDVEAAVSARGLDPDNPLEADLKFTPVAWDALALVTFPSNPVASIKLEQLHDVLVGKIKDWKELGGKPGAINLYAVAGPFDGVEFALRRLVLGSGRAGTAAQRWYVNTVQLEAAVAIDPVGLGVTLLSEASTNKGLKVIAIDGVAPSVANADYALVAPLYAVTRANAGGAAARWLDYLAEADVQKQLRTRRLLPASDAGALAANTTAREAILAGRLGLDRVMVAALPPLPPPVKTTPRNPVRFAAAGLLVTVPALTAAPKSATDLPRSGAVAAQGVKTSSCLEQC